MEMKDQQNKSSKSLNFLTTAYRKMIRSKLEPQYLFKSMEMGEKRVTKQQSRLRRDKRLTQR